MSVIIMKIKCEQITITVPNDLMNRARVHCRKTGKTFSGLVRVAIEKEMGEVKND